MLQATVTSRNFSAFPPDRLSSVFVNSFAKKCLAFHYGATYWMVSLEAARASCDATGKADILGFMTKIQVDMWKRWLKGEPALLWQPGVSTRWRYLNNSSVYLYGFEHVLSNGGMTMAPQGHGHDTWLPWQRIRPARQGFTHLWSCQIR